MTRTLNATFDGASSLKLDEQLDLAPNTIVRVTIETVDVPAANDFLAVCLAANLDGPEDWSENLEHYLYGDKRDSSE
ncbi:hypothetical protein CCAX7_44750 [Capsulimonas corticalis]|uniref:Uncharacterized protein n=1 Tax=Capsulimonas corticalis TaxID=2219043 RepID=A0A402CX73_9BACT|nr:hypothetical protein [Capsulimonas corticalis]BDI32424.1 hypothetical protein CCAX7_44750 [Capsulimonas corticalis]